ncbi:hypothetical protein GQ457_06G017260 [Hibiscus cannabinus]
MCDRLGCGMVRPRRGGRTGGRRGGRAPVHLDEIGMEPVNEETLPPPPVGGKLGESKKARGIKYNICSSTPRFLQFWCRVSVPKSNTGIWVSVPAREGIGTPCNAPGIDTWGGVSVPKCPLELEYRYWLSSTDTSCLKIDFGTP